MKKKILISLVCLALLAVAMPTLAQITNDLGLNIISNQIQLPTRDPREVAARIINVALGFLGIIAVIIVLYGGFMWMTAGGNEERVTKAKQILAAGIIGLVIIIMSWAIARYVVQALISVANQP